jgi:hypothetical protein
MRMGALQKLVAAVITSVALVTVGNASAADASGSVVEISPPPPGVGADATMLRTAAEAELRDGVQATLRRDHRRVVISLAVRPATVPPAACSVNATVRDARTGAMLAIIETNTRAEGPVSAEQRKQLAYAAVRRAVRSVPRALRDR